MLHPMFMDSQNTHSKTHLHMGHDVRKPVFGVSDKVRLKPVSSATETS